MAEGAIHKALVHRLEAAISIALGPKAQGIVDRDGGYRDPTWMIGRAFPDVRAFGQGIEVIGEAKTPRDLETARSQRQIASFMRYVEQMTDAHLVLSVQWHTTSTAWNLLRRCASDWHAVRSKVHVLNGLSELFLRTQADLK